MHEYTCFTRHRAGALQLEESTGVHCWIEASTTVLGWMDTPLCDSSLSWCSSIGRIDWCTLLDLHWLLFSLPERWYSLLLARSRTIGVHLDGWIHPCLTRH